MLKAIVLAAGKGTRMRSDNPKVLFEVAGSPMINYVIEAARGCGVQKIIVVVGCERERVMSEVASSDVVFCCQKEQNGTGDAVRAALSEIDDSDNVLILCGDMPLVQAGYLSDFIKNAKKSVNVISMRLDNPYGYGRIKRADNGDVLKIVEEKDASEIEKNICEVNSGVYFVSGGVLKKRLASIKNDNAQKEYYLTDIIHGGDCAYCTPYAYSFAGVNDRKQLAAASKVLWRKRADVFMESGVSIIDPDVFYCDRDVKIGRDSVIYPNVSLEKGTVVGSCVEIRQGARVVASNIADGCIIKDNTLIEESIVGAFSQVGPMAHLRPGSNLLGDNKIGNFVETKKATVGRGSKASHLTYLGDAEIGSDVNVGCGTITCNYDGYQKHRTVIGNNVFVGSDVQFVAPVKVGDGVLIAAGATITKDVPENALAIARARQENIADMGREISERNRERASKN